MDVAFWVRAGEGIGWGHYMRSLALARELRDRGCNCHFCGNEPVTASAAGEGFATAETFAPADVWVVDLRDLSLADVNRVRQYTDLIVNLNGGDCDDDGIRVAADLVFYLGPSDLPYHLDWSGFQGKWYEGAEWVMLRDEFQQHRRQRSLGSSPHKIVIIGGGSDIGSLTERAALALCDHHALRVILGVNTPLAKRGWAPRGVEVLINPPSMAIAMDWADLAVVSYGTVAYEALCLGLPVVAFSYRADHKRDADLDQARSCYALRSAGRIKCATARAIRAAVEQQASVMAVKNLSQAALDFIDGQGAARIADLIEAPLEAPRRTRSTYV